MAEENNKLIKVLEEIRDTQQQHTQQLSRLCDRTMGCVGVPLIVIVVLVLFIILEKLH